MTQQEQINVSTELLLLITSEQAWHYHIIPKDAGETRMQFYSDKKGAALADELEILFQKEVALEVIDENEVQRLLGKYYRRNETPKKQGRAFSQRSEDFLQALIAEARELGSSDIHIEAFEEKSRVRMRIDGHL